MRCEGMVTSVGSKESVSTAVIVYVEERDRWDEWVWVYACPSSVYSVIEGVNQLIGKHLQKRKKGVQGVGGEECIKIPSPRHRNLI